MSAPTQVTIEARTRSPGDRVVLQERAAPGRQQVDVRLACGRVVLGTEVVDHLVVVPDGDVGRCRGEGDPARVVAVVAPARAETGELAGGLDLARDLHVAVATAQLAGIVGVDHVAEAHEEIRVARGDHAEQGIAAALVPADVLTAHVAPESQPRRDRVGSLRRSAELAPERPAIATLGGEADLDLVGRSGLQAADSFARDEVPLDVDVDGEGPPAAPWRHQVDLDLSLHRRTRPEHGRSIGHVHEGKAVLGPRVGPLRGEQHAQKKPETDPETGDEPRHARPSHTLRTREARAA